MNDARLLSLEKAADALRRLEWIDFHDASIPTAGPNYNFRCSVCGAMRDGGHFQPDETKPLSKPVMGHPEAKFEAKSVPGHRPECWLAQALAALEATE